MFSAFAAASLGLVLLPFVSAITHDIQVGAEGKLLFWPEAIGAAPGDQVVFHFHPKNHTVTQSSLDNPCGRKEGGFSSGFQPVAANTSTDALPTWTYVVENYDPTWAYCAQGINTANGHCGKGMVFSINCGPDGAPNSFSNFKHSALAIGEKFAAEAAASAAPSAAPTPAAPYGGAWTTAAYGDYTIPAEPTVSVVTKTVTVTEAATTSSWTTVYTSYPNSPEPTPVALEGVEHKVIVGGPGKLLFEPATIKAAPRDTIVFEFRQKNHTLTESTFADPCRRKNVEGVLGFASGFQPVAEGATEFPTFRLKINDTAPIWAFCNQGNHCGQGMVFSVNSDETSARNHEAFVGVAKALNGTALGAESGPQPTTPANDDSGASHLTVGAGLFSILAVVAALL